MKKSQKAVEALFRQVLTELGAVNEPAYLDVANTPRRVAAMFSNELLVGYKTDIGSLRAMIRKFPAKGQREMVVQTGIHFNSTCAHHLLPFTGTVAIGYLPSDHLLGLSKFSRIIDYFAARLQIQERLGSQIVDFLMEEVNADCAFCLIRAEHHCMKCRGVRKEGVQTVTASVRPLPPIKDRLEEFYRLVLHGEHGAHL